MLRIVWGVVFIVGGVLLILSAAFGSVLMGELSKITGEAVTAQDNMVLLRDCVFGACLCFVGSLMVYCGDQTRQERIERIVDLLTVRQKSDKGEEW